MCPSVLVTREIFIAYDLITRVTRKKIKGRRRRRAIPRPLLISFIIDPLRFVVGRCGPEYGIVSMAHSRGTAEAPHSRRLRNAAVFVQPHYTISPKVSFLSISLTEENHMYQDIYVYIVVAPPLRTKKKRRKISSRRKREIQTTSF